MAILATGLTPVGNSCDSCGTVREDQGGPVVRALTHLTLCALRIKHNFNATLTVKPTEALPCCAQLSQVNAYLQDRFHQFLND